MAGSPLLTLFEDLQRRSLTEAVISILL